MFWSGNYIVVRGLNILLKEENVTLSQVLEAEDILQECKAENKALILFLTKPEVLAELITLITEEPPKNVELASQYRHASIACEVLTSQLSMLSDRLSLDTVQMNRLCDFINKDPPLNPLLASYFSKTVEMLLERSPKQDWYLYHIVCLRVLDFFKSRRDFLPNLLRHISTSAIADTFKYFIRLDDLFNKIIMEWLEEHQFLESLIQIICGTYVPEEPPAAPVPDRPEKGQRDASEKPDADTDDDATNGDADAHDDAETARDTNGPSAQSGESESERERERERAARVAAVASANAAALLCELVGSGCAGEGCSTRPRTSRALVARLQAEASVRALLQGMFTSPAAARRHAVVNGCHVLLALLDTRHATAGEGEAERARVELAVAPHLPLLHHALLRDPALCLQEQREERERRRGVGLARVQAAALLAQLALSEVEEVPTTMLTLGTPGVLVDMFFEYPNNNFLHAQVYGLVKHALNNRVYRTQYARHLLVECDLLTRLMDAFEENEDKKAGAARSGYMGHVVHTLELAARALDAAPDDAALTPGPGLRARWLAFRDKLCAVLQRHDTPLGGYYPSENSYEVENIGDTLAVNYDFNDISATANMDDIGVDIGADDANEMCGADGHTESSDYIVDGLGLDDNDKMTMAQNNFLELANQRFDDDMWDDAPEEGEERGEFGAAPAAVRDVLGDVSPWEGSAACADEAEAGWAQFGAPPDPAPPAGFDRFWTYGGDAAGDPENHDIEERMRALRLGAAGGAAELANNLLTAMSGMTPAAIANIVNANITPTPASHLLLKDATSTQLQVDNTTPLTGTTQSESAHSPPEVKDTTSTPAEVKDTTSTPAEVKDMTSTSAEVKDTSSTPAEVKDTTSTPAEVKDTASTPAEVKDTTSTPSEVKDALPEVEGTSQAQEKQSDTSER